MDKLPAVYERFAKEVNGIENVVVGVIYRFWPLWLVILVILFVCLCQYQE